MTSSPNSAEVDLPAAPDSQADAAALFNFLSNRDVQCPDCNYNLRGLASARCPECGNRLQLTIGLVEAKSGAWICAIVAILPASPFGLLAGIAILMQGVPSADDFRRAGPWPIFLLSYAVLAVPAALGLLVFRRAFLRSSKSFQASFALAAVAIDLAGLLTILTHL